MSDASNNLVLTLLRAIRGELADIRGLTLALNDKVQRLDRTATEIKRDIHEVKDDIWIMLKAELMGRQGNFETRIDAELEALSARMANLEGAP